VIMSEVKQALIEQLGPSDPLSGSNNHISTFGGISVYCRWPAGSVSLVRAHARVGYSISFTQPDPFGSWTESLRLFTLPRETAASALVAAMVVSVHHYRDGVPMPSPYRWGLTAGTVFTSVADALEPLDVTPTAVSAAFLQCTGRSETGSRTVILFQGDTLSWITMAVFRGDVSATSRPPADRWLRFPNDTSPQHLAAVIAFWLTLEAVSPQLFHPYRHGIDSQDLALNQVARALHERGLQIVRVDSDRMRVLTGGSWFPDLDLLTLLDTGGRVLVLGKSPGATPGQLLAVWRLLEFEVPKETDIAGRVDLSWAPLTFSVGSDGSPAEPCSHVWSDQVSPQDLAALVADAFERDGVYMTELSVTELQAGGNMDGLLRAIATEQEARSTSHAGTAIPRPELRLIRTPQDAECAAAAWMRWMGYDDAEVTGPGADGGVDVTSRRSVAQVKTETLPVGRPALQRLHGVAMADGKEGLFFSLSGYTSQAVEWADLAGMPLFRFDLQGEPQAANAHGQQRLR
jgi:hypothetical protein